MTEPADWNSTMFPLYLRQVRASLGLTASEAAWQAGVRPVTWYSWESGRRAPNEAAKAKIRAWAKRKKAQIPGL